MDTTTTFSPLVFLVAVGLLAAGCLDAGQFPDFNADADTDVDAGSEVDTETGSTDPDIQPVFGPSSGVGQIQSENFRGWISFGESTVGEVGSQGHKAKLGLGTAALQPKE